MSIYLYITRLPNTYQEVEYIQSSGTQYIDTGVSANQYLSFEADFMALGSTTDAPLFGARTGASSNRFGLIVYSGHFHMMLGNTSSSSFNNLAIDTNRHYGKVIYDNGSFVSTIDGVTDTATAGTSAYVNQNFWLFNYNYGSVAPCPMRLYSFKLYIGNSNLVRHFIPCYRKADSVIGLYDLVNNVFYTNSGTGNFTKGNDVTDRTKETEIKTMYIGEYVNLDPITFSYTGSDQHRTVPYTGTYRITCKGAGSNTAAGGLGQGDLQLTKGDEYTIVVGQKGSATSGTTYGFGGSSNYSNNRAGGGLSGFFTGSTTVAATDSARALVIGGGAGGGQSSSRAGGKGGGETGQNGQGSNYGTAGGGGTQTGRNSGGNVGANQFNGGNGSRTYGWGGGGGWWGGNGSIGDGSGDDDKGAGGGSGYVISTASNRVLTQGGGSAIGADGSVLIEFIPS